MMRREKYGAITRAMFTGGQGQRKYLCSVVWPKCQGEFEIKESRAF